MQKIEDLKRRLKHQEIIIMDGGMGSEILHRGIPTALPLWSAAALWHHPEVVQQIHEDYIRAGAEIIVTDTFRTTRRAFAKEKRAEEAPEMTRLACELAQEAIRQTNPKHMVWIAGSIAPLEDCYSPELTPPQQELEKEHDEFVTDLKNGGVDFLLFETMITLRETLSGLQAAERHALPVAVSFCCNDGFALLGGEALESVIPQIERYQPIFVGINCISVDIAHKLAKHLRDITPFPLAIYAQGHAIVDSTQTWKVDEEKSIETYIQAARQWVGCGAQIIGGCCGTTPSYIQQLATALRK